MALPGSVLQPSGEWSYRTALFKRIINPNFQDRIMRHPCFADVCALANTTLIVEPIVSHWHGDPRIIPLVMRTPRIAANRG